MLGPHSAGQLSGLRMSTGLLNNLSPQRGDSKDLQDGVSPRLMGSRPRRCGPEDGKDDGNPAMLVLRVSSRSPQPSEASRVLHSPHLGLGTEAYVAVDAG